jgi:short-chain fatty acids transporter
LTNTEIQDIQAVQPTRLERIVEVLTSWSDRWTPGAFSIACLLTLVTFCMVLFVQHKSPVDALHYWTEGFWKLLELAMQMGLIVLTGYTVAVSPPASRFLNALAGLPKSNRGAVVLMGLVSMALSWTHWGLGLVGAPIFMRFLVRKNPRVDYRLSVAAGYLGSACTWHAGLSGSATLLMATPKHFMESVIGIIPMSTTTFSPFNMVLTAVVVLVMVGALMLLDPKRPVGFAGMKMSDQEPVAATASHSSHGSHGSQGSQGSAATATSGFSPARALENGYGLNLVMGLIGIAGLVAMIVNEGFHPSLNLFNFVFIFLALLLYPNPKSFVEAAAGATGYLHGIIVQFPLYAGMYGLIQLSGLAVTVGDWFVSIANPKTFPVIIYWYSGILSYFIPSGGSKWVVEAPYVLAAAKSLGVPVQQAILAYAWGDMSTHFMQPFWAIPLLAIARLEFKDIIGYLVVLFAINSVVVSAAFLLMPWVW